VHFWPRVITTIIALLSATFATAETRVALIVGNANYANPDLKLVNPANDAEAMQRALQSAGFLTIVRLNASRVELYRAVEEFSTKISRDPHSIGLFYYAGHGVQVDGTNYLIPVDADIRSVPDLEANAFDVGRVLRAMQEAQNDMNIVILDACRNNPLPRTRGIERGLARMNAPSGAFIAYAAAPGQTAQDGRMGANGVFTGELLKAMAEPGVPLEQMYKRVIAAVKSDTHGGQQPWSESSIQGDFYFHANPIDRTGSQALAGSHAAVAARPLDPGEIELSFWESIKDSKNPADFRAYLDKYPHGEFAGLAANRLTAQSLALQPVTAQAKKAAPTDHKSIVGDRCKAILERAQIGDPVNDEDRAYLTAHCQ